MRDTDSDGPVSLDAEERELVRALILAEPELVLADDQVMRALIRATGPMERNVVDLRDKLVERLETRLRRLVSANRSMIAAAYENVASTEAVHTAVLAIMEAPDLPGLARALADVLPPRVSIEAARLGVEAEVDDIHPATNLGKGGEALLLMPKGTVRRYLDIETGMGEDAPLERITLRAAPPEAEMLYEGAPVTSEALMPLRLETGIGLLALGSADPERFTPEQGTDLLAFLGRVTELQALRHLTAY
ncbi:MAG: DUF484 family protein, partial [Pseudomonadota bacterium]